MNWGYKIIIGGALFMLFIIGMSVVMIMRSGNDELIDKDYYQKGLDFDADYNKQQEAAQDAEAPLIEVNKAGVKILFRTASSYTLECKRPSNAALDKLFKGQATDQQELNVPRSELAPGPWYLILAYQKNGKSYLIKREIMLP
jgi:hypothetical protein